MKSRAISPSVSSVSSVSGTGFNCCCPVHHRVRTCSVCTSLQSRFSTLPTGPADPSAQLLLPCCTNSAPEGPCNVPKRRNILPDPNLPPFGPSEMSPVSAAAARPSSHRVGGRPARSDSLGAPPGANALQKTNFDLLLAEIAAWNSREANEYRSTLSFSPHRSDCESRSGVFFSLADFQIDNCIETLRPPPQSAPVLASHAPELQYEHLAPRRTSSQPRSSTAAIPERLPMPKTAAPLPLPEQAQLGRAAPEPIITRTPSVSSSQLTPSPPTPPLSPATPLSEFDTASEIDRRPSTISTNSSHTSLNSLSTSGTRPRAGPAALLPDACSGPLSKLSKSTLRKVWTQRHFVLADGNLFLYRSDSPDASPLSVLTFTSRSSAAVAENGLWVIDVVGEGRTADYEQIVERRWALQCRDCEDMIRWLNAFRAACAAAVKVQSRIVEDNIFAPGSAASVSGDSKKSARRVVRRVSLSSMAPVMIF
ncbi:hypothetical protein BDK51DRAFT_44540 [Blyttiomyces helicus]|uniref:PH domain-containing protein n=1 Tax=Blyttiomyces helicus TaxID=388810 RepID=A0A4P9VX43_9FUNG|nr:hypothetical protein BDK51DRAFT_44540 [Blyttiomyces helicus]|eukprot:RKO84289.1 hypothetical protein BDK51DRAFT_44540 [Blyttiomyces helicus]